jgi:hypothetical protein
MCHISDVGNLTVQMLIHKDALSKSIEYQQHTCLSNVFFKVSQGMNIFDKVFNDKKLHMIATSDKTPLDSVTSP